MPRRGLTVVFTGDTAPCTELTSAARNADLLVMDATYPSDAEADKAALYGHSTFPQAGQTASLCKARALWLTHYSAVIKDPEEHIDQARAHFPEAICGQDGLSVSLAFSE